MMATAEPTLENSIRQSRRPSQAESSLSRDEHTDGAASRKKRAAAPNSVPDEVRRRFVQVGRKYFFPDGARAFTDRGQRLTTPSENTEVIRSLVAIAHGRGWNEITVTGTERFRKEAWFEARLAGLEVRGFKPSDVENERLVRTLARREQRSDTPETATSPKERAARGSRSVAEESEPSSQGTESPEKLARGSLIVGRLIDHGAATYRHQAREPMSYFVKLETERGERAVWGVDFERAFKESLTKPQIGEEVGLRAIRQDPVTVKARRRDADGQEVADQDLDTHRNRWIIEKRAFFEARAAAAEIVRDPTIDPREAVRQHPELASAYLHLRGAEEVAARRIRDPEDQRKFVSLVRNTIADSVERGEPLQPVRLRKPRAEPAKSAVPRTPNRDPNPAR
jgi:putative DNA primase/helicase